MAKKEGMRILMQITDVAAEKILVTIKKDESEFVLGPLVLSRSEIGAGIVEQIEAYDAKATAAEAAQKAEDEANEAAAKEKLAADKLKAKAKKPGKEKEIKTKAKPAAKAKAQVKPVKPSKQPKKAAQPKENLELPEPGTEVPGKVIGAEESAKDNTEKLKPAALKQDLLEF